jgi:tetratricopeptide (TPR) repeat protein
MAPSLLAARCQLAHLYHRQGKYEDAVREYEYALKIDPNFDPRVYNEMGKIYAKIGMFNEALVNFKNACRIDPDYAEARTNMEDIKWRLKKQ